MPGILELSTILIVVLVIAVVVFLWRRSRKKVPAAKVAQPRAERAHADDHNGWHAYRRIISRVTLTSDSNWYARPHEDASNYLITAARKQEIVRIIEEEYGVKLTEGDKAFILSMRSPHQLTVDFPNRFSPSHYPDLVSDYPPADGTARQICQAEGLNVG